jgi:hypothetical protein
VAGARAQAALSSLNIKKPPTASGADAMAAEAQVGLSCAGPPQV